LLYNSKMRRFYILKADFIEVLYTGLDILLLNMKTLEEGELLEEVPTDSQRKLNGP
jgi:hypothetical protein